MASFKLENANANWTKTIDTPSLQIAGTKNNDATPSQETGEVTAVVENTFENPTYSVQNKIISSEASNPLTYSDILDIYTSTSTELYLIVKYGGEGSNVPETTLPSTLSNYQDKIPVKLQSFNTTFSANDSLAAAEPSVSLTFIEHNPDEANN